MSNRSRTLQSHSSLILAVGSLLAFASACGSAPRSTIQASSDDTVVAKVGDREFTLDEVDERAVRTNMKTYQDLYNVRRDALEALIADALLQREADSRGVSVEELEAQEIEAKVEPVTETDVQNFYNVNRARLRGQTLEQIGGQIREFLEAQNEAAVRQSYIDELKREAGVAVALEPPRVPIRVAEAERSRGPANAKVTIVEYSDFQ
jgi:hypothetical protein